MQIKHNDPTLFRQVLGSQPYYNLTEATNSYRSYLIAKNLPHTFYLPYILVGEKEVADGWLIHISIVKQQMEQLLNTVLDFLIQSTCSFVIPVDVDHHSIILDGRAGLMNVGKVFSIYIHNQDSIGEITTTLIKLTSGFKGPEIPEAVHLGTCVYVSYGALPASYELFNNKYYSPVFGYEAEHALLERIRSLRVKWPLKAFVSLKKKKKSHLIKSQYLPVQSLKNDSKGNVLKCIKLNRLYNMQWCIMKQGKKYQCFDDTGRDIRDRLLWQYRTHKLLEEKIPIPKVIEYFEVKEDAYITFEFIDGVPLSEKVNTLFQGLIWKFLAVEVKREVIDYLIQIVNILVTFHQNGFIHRDINPGNFLVTREGSVVAIDIELCYNFKTEDPSPAFTLGTLGYISPQQLGLATPAIEDDIYGLGALLIKTLTGLSPSKLSTETPDPLLNMLQYFIGYSPVELMICSCLSDESSLRPNFRSIKQTLEVYDVLLLTVTPEKIDSAATATSLPEINSTIQKVINSLSIDLMLGANKEWLSKTQADQVLANELMDYRWYPGFHSGVVGILFTLSLAEKLGYDITRQSDTIHSNLNYLEKETDGFKDLQAGLWHGSYGVAIAISALIESGLLENNVNHIYRIHQLLSKPTKDLNIANGLAGKGLCILYCQGHPQLSSLQQQLPNIVSAIIKEQQMDGAWLLKKDDTQTKGINVTGFAYGIAGITYFLLKYYSEYEYHEVKTAIIKSLKWLISQRKISNGNLLWTLNPQIQIFDPWLENGFTGIALTFIKAYEVLQDSQYKEIATHVLFSHPKYISSNYFTLSNGLSGLGEVYLEAFKIFKNDEWKEKAYHISNFLIHTRKIHLKDTIYWLDGNYTRPTADLMTGNAGILHFLLRCVHPEKINFPV